ncbi:MAG: filamentous hemagglutinin family protein [Panacagrimonas sp.]
MTSNSPTWQLSSSGRLRRLALLSVLGVVSQSAQAGAGFGSPQFFEAARMSAQVTPPPRPGNTPGGATQPTLPNGVSSPEAAAARAQRSIQSLQQSIQKIDAETLRQRNAAQALQFQADAVPNGLAPGGLVPVAGAAPSTGDACLNAAQCLWVNAELPTQTVAQGETTVRVRQTDQKAILTWDSFNVGADTTLHIDQRQGTQADGGNDWVALNRVAPGVQPSVVQGTIKAEGAVYVINQNGLLFDAGSVVDTHSLIASTLPMYLPDGSQGLKESSAADIEFGNRVFLTSGLTSQSAGTSQGSVLGLPQRGGAGTLSIASAELLPEALPGEVRIAAGARLSVKEEGFALIAAPNVRNDGIVEGSDSQIALVAGIGVQVDRSASPGSRYEVSSAGRVTDQSRNNADITPVFGIENTGMILSRRGGVSLLGTRIEQDGVLQATTSVARQGFIELDANDSTGQQERYGLVTFGSDSLTAILPDGDATKTNSSPSADDQFQPLGVDVTGSAIVLNSGALIEAPGHSVDLLAVAENSSTVVSTVNANESVAGRVFIAPDATIDVSGLADVLVPLANLLVTVPRLGLNELADSPLQRLGVLFGSSIVFDVRDLGTRADGLSWIGTPLANLAGFVENISRGVNELLTNGGSISLIGNEVIAQQGSALNLAGGYLHYGSGRSNGTRLITASGAIVNIADADPNERYVGFAGRTTELHPRWNVTRNFMDPLLSAGAATVFENDDIGGGRAGSLTVFGQSSSVIAADIDAHAVSGERQVVRGRPSQGGTLQFGGNFAGRLFPEQNTVTAGPSYAIVEALDPDLLTGFGANSDPFRRGGDPRDTRDPAWWTPISATTVRQSGASVLRVIGDLPNALTMGGEVAVVDGANVAVTPGGNATGDNGAAISGASIELSGSRIDIDGRLTAPAGRIMLTATGRTYLQGSTVEAGAGEDGPLSGDIVVSGDSVLDVRGQFVNDNGLGDEEITGSAYINGGSIALSTLQSSLTTDQGTPPVDPSEEDPDGEPGTPATVTNLTGSILLGAGSRLDAISGARIAPNGEIQRTSDDVVRGTGGSIALSTFVANGSPFGRNQNLPTPTELLDGAGRIELGAELLGFGFERGGRLAIRAPGILIDGASGGDERGFLSLDTGLFNNSGFSAFRLDAVFDATVQPGITINVAQRNFLVPAGAPGDALALSGFATGSDLADAFDDGAIDIGRLDAFHRRPSSFELYSGDYLNWVAGETAGALVPPDLRASGVTGTTLVDRGARILADARSTLVLGSHGQVTLFGELRANGGDVTLTVDTARGGYLNNPGAIVNPYTSNSKSVFLGAESRIDVSGTTLFDTTSVPEGTSAIPVGDVIDGGSVTLSADTGFVIALNCADSGDCAGSAAPVEPVEPAPAASTQARTFNIPKFGGNPGTGGGGPDDEEEPPVRTADGALIDISGTTGVVGLLEACLRIEDATQLFSDAGRVRIGAASGLFFNGVIAAQPGGPRAQGGSLAITPLNPLIAPENGFEGARRLVLSDVTAEVPDTFLVPGAPVTRAPTRILNFGIDVLEGSGIASLSLGTDPSLSREPVPIDIVTDLDLNLGRELQINTLLLSARPAIQDRGRMKPIEVSLSAPYVAIHGYSEDIGVYNDFEEITAPNLAEVRQPISQLTVDARILDIGGQIAVENFKDVALTGSDEIRFVTPPQYASFASGGSGEYTTLPGVLLVGGNLDLTAGRIYPATNHTQILLADNHLRRSDLEVIVKPTQRSDPEDPDSDPLTTLQTIYEPNTAKIRIARSGSSLGNAAPLSVGGRLIVSAFDIEQNGALYAPGGQIQLGIASEEILEGVNDDSQVFDYELLPYFRFALPTVVLESAFRFDDLAFEDPLDTDDTERYTSPVKTQLGLETITRNVSFGAGSITSVSLAGLSVPYGRTVDGLNLVYNGTGDTRATVNDLRQSPDKRIGTVGATVDIQRGATVDVSGGGDLIASEFVAGTGGSRDVLSTTMISFAGGEENLVSLFPDGRDVYAILPGYRGVAPYDPAFTRRDPDGPLTGTQISASESTRAPLVGRAVFLSGVPGLPEGTYTLLPGAYATLPGAFRLVQDTRPGAQDAIGRISNLTLPDGTLQIAGQYVDRLSGARSAHSTSFLVQPRAVWTQYSQYDFTSLNRYFNGLEAASDRALRAPSDGGTLALSALTKLALDGDILGSAPSGFDGLELQLSAPRIEITDGGNPRSGFLSIDANRLNAMGASRLVIGATTGNSDDGIEEFYVGADTVIAATVDTPLRAGEIVLIARGDEANGVVVQQDAQLIATGTATGRRGPEISIGGEGTRQRQIRSTDPDDFGAIIDADEPDLVDIAGDGGFLQVSVNNPNAPGRLVVTGLDGPAGSALGSVSIGSGARLSGAGSVGLDASGSVFISPSASIESTAFLASTSTVTVADRDSASGGGDLLLGPTLQAQLADIEQIFLVARERLNFVGDPTLRARQLVELIAGQLDSDGGSATLDAARVIFSNQLGSPGTGLGGLGTLTVNAGEIELLGDRSANNSSLGFDGFGQVFLNADRALIAAGRGRLDLGDANLFIDAPLFAAASGADLALGNASRVEAVGAQADAATASIEGFGGAFSVSADSILWSTLARARAGSIRFEAGGDIRLGADAALDASGAVFAAYDRSIALSAGAIALQTTQGTLRLDTGSQLDVSAGAAGGDAGRIGLRSGSNAVVVQGELKGTRADGARGARLLVDSRGAVDLESLAGIAAQGGIDGAIALRSGSGDLSLGAGRTLAADEVRLVADGGHVRIDGTIDASGAEGGAIALFGQRGVAVTGSLLANARTGSADGGSVEIGVGAVDTSATDAEFGYRALTEAQAGRIDIAGSAVIDVRGRNGELKLRAPLLADGRVPVTVATGATIRGDADPELEIFARWDVSDSSRGEQHFSGTLNPSGFVPPPPPPPVTDPPTEPTPVDPVLVLNATNDARFVTETLADYVRAPGWQIDGSLGQAADWLHRAGIDLTNESAAVNGGDIRVTSDWNLAAGSLDADGKPVLDFRTAGLAPTISLRAAGDVLVGASISDGFFQTVNPFNPAAATTDVNNTLAPVGTATNPLPLATASLLGLNGDKPYDSASLRIVAGADTSSADALALSSLADPLKGNVILSGRQTAVSNAPGNENRTFVTPTMIRTGVGSIDVVAASDIRITDTQAPGVIYTAGHAGIQGVVRPGQTALQAVAEGRAPVLDTGTVQPRDAGDLRLSAGRDIVSITTVVDTDGTRSGAAGTDLTQFWWPWMQSSCITTVLGCGEQDSASINHGMFAQGLLSSGGDIEVDAGRDITALSVSMPTTWTRTNGARRNNIGGGGELDVYAGGDIRGGSYFVSAGIGAVRALGVLGDPISADAPLLALQDARLAAEAAQGLNIGGVFNPSYLFANFDSNAYGADSAVRLVTAAGDARLGTAAVLPGSRYGSVPGETGSPVQPGAFYILPASLSVAAASGSLTLGRGGELFPSANGQLELFAQRNITLQGRSNSGDRLGLIDAVASLLPSIDNPLTAANLPASGSFIDQGSQSNFLLRDPDLLHAHDPEPVRIYSVAGSLLNGYRATDAATAADPLGVPDYVNAGNGLRLRINKPATVRAGLDIVNLNFSGQNFYASDITTIAAGRDLRDPVLQRTRFVPLLELGGPGTFALSAGRNIGPITSAGDARDAGYLFLGNEQFPGIRTVGNANNLFLDRTGADISISYGVGPGVNLDEFAATYIDPAILHDPLDPADTLGTPDYTAQLVAYVRQQLIDAQARDGRDRSAQIAGLNPAGAWNVFRMLAVEQRQKFAAVVFLDILNQVGLDFNAVTRTVVDRAHPQGIEYNADNIRFAGQYGRGYEAIEALFPAALGYTQNALDGTQNGALVSRVTGTLDIRGSTIQTRFGGDIDILGPGGPVLIGSTGAPPFTAATGNTAAVGPSSQGILALQAGSIRLFSDDSIQLAQSRVFTQAGGDLLIWSSNGDINAGKGAKTSSEVPPLDFSCDDDLFCVVDTQSQVSGAGIAALQTDPTQPPGSANLIAPVGTVDAGDAGIRVSGSLNVAALQVANADNIQVSGVKVGVPTGVVDTAAVSVASSVAAAVTASADQAAGSQTRREAELELFVEILTPKGENECDASLGEC